MRRFVFALAAVPLLLAAGAVPTGAAADASVRLVYLSPVFGGLLSDRLLGHRRAVVIGAMLLALGYFLLAMDRREAEPSRVGEGFDCRADCSALTSGACIASTSVTRRLHAREMFRRPAVIVVPALIRVGP